VDLTVILALQDGKSLLILMVEKVLMEAVLFQEKILQRLIVLRLMPPVILLKIW
jgi:hypothetical protein